MNLPTVPGNKTGWNSLSDCLSRWPKCPEAQRLGSSKKLHKEKQNGPREAWEEALSPLVTVSRLPHSLSPDLGPDAPEPHP